MSRKQYRDMAEVINDELARWGEDSDSPLEEQSAVQIAIHNIASGLATVFKIDNPRFDRQRFMTACNIDEEDILNHR